MIISAKNFGRVIWAASRRNEATIVWRPCILSELNDGGSLHDCIEFWFSTFRLQILLIFGFEADFFHETGALGAVGIGDGKEKWLMKGVNGWVMRGKRPVCRGCVERENKNVIFLHLVVDSFG